MNEHKKHICLGVLAHVDAGKTTLAEGILYLTGAIRNLGRVDHQDAFLDNFALERARGITIFSKQAEVQVGDTAVTLIDTPGHVDFSAEMERTLGILDYAVLVISGADGVQSHVETLWRLLAKYEIPVFLFVNKMDQPGTDPDALLAELQKKLDGRCLRFSDAEFSDPDFQENIALCDEALLERYLEAGTISREDISGLIAKRKVFPCYFGSALRLSGVEALLEGICSLAEQKKYREAFGARVYKISRDSQGNRLTHLKVTGGRLKVKELLTNRKKDSASQEGIWEEKVNQIRIYSGASFQAVGEAEAGMVCAVTGLTQTRCGEGLGAELESVIPVLEPVLSYQIQLPEDCDVHQTYRKLLQLEEEEPELHITWNEQLNELYAQLMGEVQIEVLKNLIRDRFDLEVEFGAGHIVYKETIAEPVIGIGHFEPLRHYAEVHLLLEPGEPGSGLQFAAACSEDVLDRNWQRLILTHLEERQHPGVLTGSEITDMKITLLAGRAHLKHTEGGDFRQATYRAVRQGLKRGKPVLLEPVYEFRIEVPAENAGRAMTDIQKRKGSFAPMELQGEMAVLAGSAPVATMRGYQTELISYTRGRGRMSCSLKGYEPCHNAEEVIAARGYDSEADTENPTGSVFCAHGAGFVVSWDLVPEYAHLDTEHLLAAADRAEASEHAQIERQDRRTEVPPAAGRSGERPERMITSEEIEAIFERTYGTARREKEQPGWKLRRRISHGEPPVRTGALSRPAVQEEYLLVDGYNIIFAWPELKELAASNIEAARTKLMDILSGYQGYRKMQLILVFDAYRVEGGQGSIQKYHDIYVVYTKEAETADQYIEKTVHAIGRKYQVTVATSDALEQVIILGQGGRRMSAANLREEIERTGEEIRSEYLNQPQGEKNYLFSHLDGDLRTLLEEVRLGKKKL